MPCLLTGERLPLPDLLLALDAVEDGAADEEVGDGHHDQTQRPHILLLHFALQIFSYILQQILFSKSRIFPTCGGKLYRKLE